MRLFRKALGIGLVVFGLFVALYPFTSTWRMSSRVLEELPAVSGFQVTDSTDRFGTAISDPDFTLATRTYEGATLGEVDAALTAHGFEGYVNRDQRGRIKSCCGEWDAVIVHLTDDPAETAPGTVLAVVSVFDTDVQSAWGVLFLLGLLIALPGLVLLLIGGGATRIFTTPETVNTAEPAGQ